MPDAALAGIRVVECGGLVSAPYAGKLLADLGADVVKVEPPEGDPSRRLGPFPPGHEGDPERSGLFLYLNANKRGVTLDLEVASGHDALLRLLADADLFLHNLPPAVTARLGLAYGDLADALPSLVVTQISPFGDSGAHRDYAAIDLTCVAAGGWAFVSPGAMTDPSLAPLKAFGHQGDVQAAVHAATAALGALFVRGRIGRGQFVDLSEQEVIAAALENSLPFWTYQGLVASRLGARTTGPNEMFRCKDGYVFIICPEDHQWEKFVRLMGNPEWAQWDVFKDRFARGANRDVVKMYIEEWLADYTRAEFFRMAGEAHLPFAPVSTPDDTLRSEQLRARGYFQTQEHPLAGALTVPGAPYRLTETPWSLRTPAPLLGQHNAELLGTNAVGTAATHQNRDRHGAGRGMVTSPVVAADVTPPTIVPAALEAAAPKPAGSAPPPRPLEGIRVIDMTWAWSGPLCAMQLAHLGAEVIRIESRKRPDTTRKVPPIVPELGVGLNLCGGFNQWSQGKGSFSVDLTLPEGRALAAELIDCSDAVVENFSPGVMDRLGLSYEARSAKNPGLVMLSLSGYGASGPIAHYAAYGVPQVMNSGLGWLSGYRDGLPREVGIAYGDNNGGLHGAFAVVAALTYRQRTGNGQWIDQSQYESLVAVIAEGLLPTIMGAPPAERMGNRDPGFAPHGYFRCAGDDRWISIAVTNETGWSALCEAMEQPGLARDPRFAAAPLRKQHEDALEAIVAAWTAPRDRWALTQQLQARGIAAFPVMDCRDLVEDAHLNERGFWVRLEHAEVGVRAHSGIPFHLSETPLAVRRPAPLMGEDNEYVVRDLLGRSREEYERLVEERVLY